MVNTHNDKDMTEETNCRISVITQRGRNIEGHGACVKKVEGELTKMRITMRFLRTQTITNQPINSRSFVMWECRAVIKACWKSSEAYWYDVQELGKRHNGGRRKFHEKGQWTTESWATGYNCRVRRVWSETSQVAFHGLVEKPKR